MSRDSVLASGRNRKFELMPEIVRVVVRSVTTNQQTLDVEDNETELYTGPARYKAAGRAPLEKMAVGQKFTELQSLIEIPVGTILLPKDAVVIITASEVDPALVDAELRIVDLPERGQTTSTRYPVEEA